MLTNIKKLHGGFKFPRSFLNNYLTFFIAFSANSVVTTLL
ncbi:MAG: hypothetical protein PWR27_323 [Petroclostridium sp.]|jgi:hypothetical protein|nr:hypothetical protein [Petroclostridium sp.]